ncbi:hypothetical protein WJX84_002628 [Apatococcus fuscideae]|uniref:Uncharacterized protein n=1 Tax=Apatococcus fuscideae TaxID=2026836 RepID=A0AAW1SX57_9CHLO
MLIDFQTLSSPALSNPELTFSPQFVAISRLNDLDLRATLQTELESLMYCYMFAATKDLLHWKHADAIPDSYNAKAAATGTYAVFREKCQGNAVHDLASSQPLGGFVYGAAAGFIWEA